MQTILIGDVRKQLATLPDNSVHCVITSPPYWGRSGIGIELNPDYAALARKRIDQVQPRMIELTEVF